MASAVYIFDHRLELIIYRQYRGDHNHERILGTYRQARRDLARSSAQKKPVIEYKNSIFGQLEYDDLIIMTPIVQDTDMVTVMEFLKKFCMLLKQYFIHYKLIHDKKSIRLSGDIIRDNVILVYELFDECFDFGVPQLTDFSILKEYIKLMIKPEEYFEYNANTNEKIEQIELQVEQEINSSVSRTAMTKISWRPKGIFYNKNELFVDCNEYIQFKYNYKTNKVILNNIQGELLCKSYLSGMPTVKLGLNETLEKPKTIFSNVQYHQCVDLAKIESNVIEFIPCDGNFKLLDYQILNTKILRPLIYVKPNYKIFEKDGKFKLRIKVELVTTFKRKFTMANVAIRIPLIIQHKILLINFNNTLRYKTKLGSVIHRLEQDCLSWNIEKLQGTMSGEMLAEFDLITERDLLNTHRENSMRSKQERNDLYYFELNEELNRLHAEDGDPYASVMYDRIMNDRKKQTAKGKKQKKEINASITVTFNMNGTTYSGVEIKFLNVIEEQLKFDSFNWKFHHVTAKNGDYSFILSEDQFQNDISEESELEIAKSQMHTDDNEEASEDDYTQEDIQKHLEDDSANDSSTATVNIKSHIKELKKKRLPVLEDFEEYIVPGETE